MSKELEIENIKVRKVDKDVVHAGINYPRHNPINTIEVGMCDVRAADNIRIKYDFDRDGWVIFQCRETHPFEGEKNGIKSYGLKEEWIESTFCPAWKFEVEDIENG
jgi:hypothetical protein